MSPGVVSLFSGVGGLDLALERWVGATPRVFVESEPYRRAVLAKHWPGVEQRDDVRAFDGRPYRGCKIVAGGFPCQDVSTMGTKTGLTGARSGLWSEFARIISEVEPDAVVIENVAALYHRGLDRVLADLAALRFDAAWMLVDGRAAGLSIQRKRYFVLALANGRGFEGEPPAWLHDQGALGHHPHRCDAAVVRNRGERGASAGPEPGLLRGALGPACGLDERRRRERLRCTGNAVSPAQAVLALRHLAQLLAPSCPDQPFYNQSIDSVTP